MVRARQLHCPGRPGPRKVLLPVDVPVPERTAAHGARAQLHDRGRDRPAPEDAGTKRAPADGLGRLRTAGGECRHGQGRRPGRLDPRQHRLYAAPVAVTGLWHRLEPGACHLRAGVLPLEPVALPAPAGEGACLPDDRHGQLGSARPDGARQRAGHRRPRLAYRRRRREARDPHVLHADYGLRRRTARGAEHSPGLAGARTPDAGQLDWPQRGRRDCLSLRHARHGMLWAPMAP